MYFNVYMFGCNTTRRHSDQMLTPVSRITVTVRAADADAYGCVYSQLKSFNSIAVSDVIF